MDFHSGVRWSAFAKYSAQGLGFVSSLILARLLNPEDFGLLGMAIAVTGFLRTFRVLGIGSVIVQRKDLSDDLLSTLYWANLFICVFFAGVVLLASPLAAWIFSDARVTPIVATLSINFVLAGFTIVPTALLTRKMEFRKLAIREIGGIAANGITSITLALLGFGVWSLVWGLLAGSLARVILINLNFPFFPKLVWDQKGLRECLSFGLNLTGFGIFNYFARNADKLIIGIFLGPAALGFYSLAHKLMLLPCTSVTDVLTRVLFPKLSRLQDDHKKLADLYLRANGAIAFITFPTMLGFAAIAHPFVDVIIGSKWLPAVPVIYILASLGALQSVCPVRQIFLAKGRADWLFRWGVCGGLLYVASYFAGLPWGIEGVALAYSITSLFWIPMSWWIAFKLVDGLSVFRLLKVLRPYAVMSGIMLAIVICTRFVVEGTNTHQGVALALYVLVGIAVYTIGVLLSHPPEVTDVLRLLPRSINRRLARGWLKDDIIV